MKRSYAIYAALFAISAVAGFSRPYEASFVMTAGERPDDQLSRCLPKDVEAVAVILKSDEFWNKYVAPHLSVPMSAKTIREGISISKREVEGDKGILSFELKVEVENGGEVVFDAVRDGLVAYFDAGFLHMKKQALDFLRSQLEGIKDSKAKEHCVSRIAEVEAATCPFRILSVKKLSR